MSAWVELAIACPYDMSYLSTTARSNGTRWPWWTQAGVILWRITVCAFKFGLRATPPRRGSDIPVECFCAGLTNVQVVLWLRLPEGGKLLSVFWNVYLGVFAHLYDVFDVLFVCCVSVVLRGG